MQKFISKLMPIGAIAFFVFILWILYLANTGGNSAFFQIIKLIPSGDKFGHFGLFGVLTFMSIIGLQFRSFKVGKLSFYYGTVFISIFALCEEVSQIFIPLRMFDWFDLSADFLGVIVATSFAYTIRCHFKKSQIREPEVNRIVRH